MDPFALLEEAYRLLEDLRWCIPITDLGQQLDDRRVEFRTAIGRCLEHRSLGVAAIARERRRQQTREGWTDEHDDGHTHELAAAAACYALAAVKDGLPVDAFGTCFSMLWPWSEAWWKPGNGSAESRMRCLEKAGALIAAEIDRRKRLE